MRATAAIREVGFMECTCVLGASQPGKSHPMPFYSITSTDQPDMGGHAASTHVNSSGIAN